MSATRRPRPTRSHRKRAAGLTAFVPPNGTAVPVAVLAAVTDSVLVIFPIPVEAAGLNSDNYELKDSIGNWSTCSFVRQLTPYALAFDADLGEAPTRWRKKEAPETEDWGSQIIPNGLDVAAAPIA